MYIQSAQPNKCVTYISLVEPTVRHYGSSMRSLENINVQYSPNIEKIEYLGNSYNGIGFAQKG